MIHICVPRRDRIGLCGRVEILVHEADSGRVRRTIETHNLIVNAGLAFVLDCIKGDTFNRANYFAVGADVTPPAPADTGLINEVFRGQVSTSRRPTGSSDQLIITCFLNSGQANGYALQEFGIFAHQDANTGPMLCRLTHSSITKNVATAVTYIWTGTLAAN